MIKNILFDLDGTLTDPKTGITTCVAYAAEKAGFGKHDPDEFISFIGPPLKNQFMNHFNTDDATGDRLLRFYRERFSVVGLFENEPYEGIAELLDKLNHLGFRLYVATSKPEIYSVRILEKFDLKKYFCKVYGSLLDGTHVEKEQLISHLLKQEKLNSDECIMIGDRKYDIIGAKENGIASVGVLYGYGCEKEFVDSGAEYIISDVDELGKLLYNINTKL